MVGIRSFPIGVNGLFSGANLLLVSGSFYRVGLKPAPGNVCVCVFDCSCIVSIHKGCIERLKCMHLCVCLLFGFLR